MKLQKTNAARILDREGIEYQLRSYPHGNEAIDGMQVAQLLDMDPQRIFKTLVTISNTNQYFVFVIPVSHELDLKKCASLVHMKRIEMIPVKDIQKITGYVRGGCSPIGMNKVYPTFFHETCMHFDTILFSAGKIGLQVEVNAKDIKTLPHIKIADIIV